MVGVEKSRVVLQPHRTVLRVCRCRGISTSSGPTQGEQEVGNPHGSIIGSAAQRSNRNDSYTSGYPPVLFSPTPVVVYRITGERDLLRLLIGEESSHPPAHACAQETIAAAATRLTDEICASVVSCNPPHVIEMLLFWSYISEDGLAADIMRLLSRMMTPEGASAWKISPLSPPTPIRWARH